MKKATYFVKLAPCHDRLHVKVIDMLLTNERVSKLTNLLSLLDIYKAFPTMLHLFYF